MTARKLNLSPLPQTREALLLWALTENGHTESYVTRHSVRIDKALHNSKAQSNNRRRQQTFKRRVLFWLMTVKQKWPELVVEINNTNMYYHATVDVAGVCVIDEIGF